MVRLTTSKLQLQNSGQPRTVSSVELFQLKGHTMVTQAISGSSLICYILRMQDIVSGRIIQKLLRGPAEQEKQPGDRRFSASQSPTPARAFVATLL